MQLYALEPLFKIFDTLACKRFPGKIADKICGKSEASVWRNLSTVTAPTI